MVIGYGLFVIGGRLLVIRYWLLVGGSRGAAVGLVVGGYWLFVIGWWFMGIGDLASAVWVVAQVVSKREQSLAEPEQ